MQELPWADGPFPRFTKNGTGETVLVTGSVHDKIIGVTVYCFGSWADMWTGQAYTWRRDGQFHTNGEDSQLDLMTKERAMSRQDAARAKISDNLKKMEGLQQLVMEDTKAFGDLRIETDRLHEEDETLGNVVRWMGDWG